MTTALDLVSRGMDVAPDPLHFLVRPMAWPSLTRPRSNWAARSGV
jgi:hypothetical protein